MADETVYDIRFDLDALISSEVESYVNNLGVEDDEEIGQKLFSLSNQLKGVERKSKEINKIFADCQDELARFRVDLETEERDQEKRWKNAEEVAEMAQKSSSDSDDDIQFVKTTYEPHHKRQRGHSPKGALLSHSSSSQGSLKSDIPDSADNEDSTQKQTQCSNVTMDSVRKALTEAINKQLPTNHSTLPDKKDIPVLMPVASLGKVIKKDTVKLTNPATKSTSYQHPPMRKISYNNPQQPIVIDDTKPDELENEIKLNDIVLAKKFNDIWYNATVADIQNGDKPVEDRRYKVKYEFKGNKVLNARSIAHNASLKFPAAVGSRVVALYRDEEVTLSTSYYAGILAESPSGRNNFRYLVFFDDGYAQYSSPDDIHRVYLQSEKVWEDIHPDSQEFIKEYLAQYPERPMVRLQKSQTIKVEWNGKWWTAKVAEVDASLVKMFFPSDKRTEWIYRGSTRLEPLYTALANAEANKAAGKGKRHNLLVKKDKKPIVEYTRGENQANKQAIIKLIPNATTTQTENKKEVDSDAKKRPVARKSTTAGAVQIKQPLPDEIHKNLVGNAGQYPASWEAPWVKLQKKQQDVNATLLEKRKERFQASSFSSNKVGRDMASVLQERLAVEVSTPTDDESFGERVPNKVSVKNLSRKPYFPHKCGRRCLKDIDDSPEKFKGNNPLLIPLLCGWERHVCKVKPSSRRSVLYRSPCVRRLRSMEEVDRYLRVSDCKLTIDAFSFDPQLHVHTEFVPVKTFCDIKDLSYGKENVAISCVNGIDRQYPDYVEYSNKRIPAKGVGLNLDPNFLSGCSCKDNCRDKSKCECRQLTIQATMFLSGGKVDKNAGYIYRRLEEPLLTGVYECNSKCNCDSRCNNRVAQNGLQRRLQVYKTEKRGWGLRCLDDIPAGGFICIYAGQLLTEQGANEDGQQYGDEYLAELDYIEVVERQKEGYESDVDEDEGMDSEEEEELTDSDRAGRSCRSSDSEYDVSKTGLGIPVNDQTVEQRTHATRRQKRLEREGSTDTKNSTDAKEISKIVLKRKSTEKNWSVKMNNTSAAKNTAAWVESLQDEGIMSDNENENKPKTEEFSVDIDDELPDLDPASPPINVLKQEESVVESEEEKEKKPFAGLPRPRKSTTTPKMSRFKNLPDPKSRKKHDEKEEVIDMSLPVRLGTRSLFGDGQMCYIMDAKSMGNLGRYLNHSCSPNVFVQNVFVDTHDLRFPWVAFFAGEFIRAGTELTWDYNYEVGSVPGKVLYCYCGSADCRGRLL